MNVRSDGDSGAVLPRWATSEWTIIYSYSINTTLAYSHLKHWNINVLNISTGHKRLNRSEQRTCLPTTHPQAHDRVSAAQRFNVNCSWHVMGMLKHFVQSNPSLLQSTNCIISCVNGSLEHVSLSRYEMYKHEINHDMMLHMLLSYKIRFQSPDQQVRDVSHMQIMKMAFLLLN